MPSVADIDAQIRQLQEQRQSVINKEKDTLVAKANDAIAKLRELGFNYRLAEMTGGSRAPRATGTGTRRTGIREQVLEAVKSGASTRSAVLDKLGANDKSGQQAVSNALAALKKAGTLTLKDGTYGIA